jgi:GH25 family lysozyme M1 (1,4-beta-N-acetylmuramidase)
MNETERNTMTTEAETSWAALFGEEEARTYKTRWDEIQSRFVDEPRDAVQQADALVNETTQRLATVFAEERSRLEQEWAQKGDVSTEDLRQALRRYRSFFERLLAV